MSLRTAAASGRRCAVVVAEAGSDREHVLERVDEHVDEHGIEVGGSTLRDFRNAEGGSGYFQHRFAVYDREGEPCPTPLCTGTVARIVQSGRSTFFCPVCQKAP